MAKIRPFKGYRPEQGYEEYVASRPYDVLNSEEAREEAKDNPYSFLRVTKPEITLPEDTYQYDAKVYTQARKNFDQLVHDRILIQDPLECLYIYRQVMTMPNGNQYRQTGIVANSSIEDYFNDVIKKHEYTRPEKEQDRINHMKATGLHSGVVFLTYPDVNDINNIVNDITKLEPQYDFTAKDGVRHTLWVVNEEQKVNALVQLFETKVPYTYIADGHHRAASSAKVGKELADENKNHTGNEPYNWFITTLFPASELNIIDYNRVVEDLNGLSEEQFLKAIADKFEIEKWDEPYAPEGIARIGMFMNHQWYRLTAKDGTFDTKDPVQRLDVSILQKNILDEILGIKDPRTDKRIDFVGGIRGLKELEKRVNSGEMAVAFSLYPVHIEQLIEIADSGNVMPPKSTWFEPKLRDGLVVHKFL